jgi:eukaryotic-like serine/threonine-protein kinase
MFHANPALTGAVEAALPEAPVLRWKFSTGGPAASSPVAADGRVFFGDADGKVYALDLATGEKLWEHPTGKSEIAAPPLAIDGGLYVGAKDGVVYALDARTGAERWTFKTGDEIGAGLNFCRSARGDRLWILVCSHDQKVYCLDAATGRSVWTFDTGNYLLGGAAVDNGQAVFSGCDSILHVLSTADGTETGKIATDAFVVSSPALAGGRAYIANNNGKLLCIDLAAGKVLWEYAPEGGGSCYASPAVGTDAVVFGSRDRQVHCVDRAGGAVRWTFATRGDVDASPVIAGDKVVACSGDGRVYLLGLADGRLLWSYEIGPAVKTSPAVASGLVLVGGDDGVVYAFGMEP